MREEHLEPRKDGAEIGLKKDTGHKRRSAITLNKLALGFTRHWVAVISLFMALYAGLPFLAPMAMHAGLTGLGNVIYTIYAPLCHQLPFRSWFLYGEQIIYPRAQAGLPGGTFEDYASVESFFEGVDVETVNPQLIIEGKRFKGSERMGWKVAFCERDVSIYAAIALFGVVYVVLRRLGIKVPYLPFWAYLLIAIIPIGLDGFSQFFSNTPFNGFGLSFYPIRESTPLLRMLTGALFGIGNAWLAYPYIDESMQESRELIEAKLIRAGVIQMTKAQAGD